jgi:enoyl-CoA hydratase/carnithine racemase
MQGESSDARRSHKAGSVAPIERRRSGMSGPITVLRLGHVAHVVFQNPPHNHATVGLLRALGDALEHIDADPEYRAVVLASEGKSFCAGADLVSKEGIGGNGVDPVREFYDQALRLFAFGKPIVAAIQGAAVGAGLGLAVAADFRIAAPEARFSANFVKLGYHPGFALTFTLPRLIGASRAALMLMTAARCKPEEVIGWGLVDRIVEAAQLRESAQAFAAEIADNAPLSLLATRRTLRRNFLEQVRAALVVEHAEQSKLRLTEDYAEGVLAVTERRSGNFVAR